MFIKILLCYIFGYIKVSVEGYYIEKFINICKNKKIIIWNLKREKNVKLYLNTSIQDFKEITKIAKKLKCHIKIEKKRGVPFLLYKYKKRKIFAMFSILIIIGVIILSNFIWNIEIKEESGKELENIYQDISNAGLTTGKLKAKLNTKEIINKIRLERQDIAWMGIELKGTNAIVRIVKADNKPEIIDEKDYCNIVSNKEGVITKIQAQNGTANVKVGDTVTYGTTLISGWLEGKYTGMHYVHARGEIEAKVWHTKNIFIPYQSTETKETGQFENFYSIKFNNFEINLSKRVSKFKIYDTIETDKKIRLFSDFYLPISIRKITNKELVEEEKRYNLEEAKQLGIQQLQEELDEEIEDKTKIMNRYNNTYEKENGIEINVTYEVLEEIGTNEKIVF